MRLLTIIAAVCLTQLYALADSHIEWLETTYDFGAFSETDGPMTAAFRFVNTGDQPVVITGARASCGCTTPRYDVRPVEPGDTALIWATYDPMDRPGRFSKTVTVNTNADNAAKTRLTLKGVVVGAPATIAQRYPVEAGCLRLSRSTLLAGNVRHDHVKSVFFDAYNATMDTVTTEFTDCPHWLEAHVINSTVAPGEQVTYSIFVKGEGDDMWGTVSDTVTVRSHCPSGVSEYRLPVVVTVDEDFSRLSDTERAKAPVATVDNQMLALGKVARGPIKGNFTITNTGKSPLVIRRAYTVAGNTQIKVSSKKIKPGGRARLTVTTDAPASQGVVSLRIQLITNDPANPVQTLRMTAER